MVTLFYFICQQDGKEEKISESGEVECLVNVCSLTTDGCHSSMKEKYVDVNAVASRRIRFEGIDNAFSSNIEPRIASLKGYGTFLQNVFTSDSFHTIANVSVLISYQHDFPR